jgi:hypothetical protein
MTIATGTTITETTPVGGVNRALNAGPHDDPSMLLGPDDTWIVDGLDWSWSFVVYREREGFPGYRIGSNGSVWSRINIGQGLRNQTRNRFTETWIRRHGGRGHSGYMRVKLSGNSNNIIDVYIHTLVLNAFVGPCPPGKMCLHRNGRQADNRLANIRWGTPKENAEDAIRLGELAHGERNGSVKLTEKDVRVIRYLLAEGYSYRQIARMFYVDKKTVYVIKTGKNWRKVEL